LYRSKHEAYVDSEFVDGNTSGDNSAIRADLMRIKEVEKDLHLVKDATEVHDLLAVDPREDGPSQRNS
jgi:hypothetical protein